MIAGTSTTGISSKINIGMGTIPIPSIDAVDTCMLGVRPQVSLVFDTEPALFMVSMYV